MYYVYNKVTKEFAGSGLTNIDNSTHTSTQVAPPLYDVGIPIWTGSAWRVVSKNPNVVSPRQIRLALIAAGISLASIDQLIADNETAKVEWEYATEIHRDHALLSQMATALELTSTEVDAIFASARVL